MIGAGIVERMGWFGILGFLASLGFILVVLWSGINEQRAKYGR